MDFQLPINSSQLGGKTITMLADVSLADCVEHLKITSLEGIIEVGSNGFITADGDAFNSITCSGRVITFGNAGVGPNYTSFTWE